jgi:two-component system response regulator HydG
VAKFAQQYGGIIAASPPDLTDAAMMRLTAYSWPGNVRQLLNVVQHMLVMAVGEPGAENGVLRLDVRHIPPEITSADAADEPGAAAAIGGTTDSPGSLAGTSLEQIEKRAIRETLRLTAGNREKAAELLGIGERTLYRKLKEYGLR